MSCHLNQSHHATPSHYPDTEPTSSCPILIMPSTRLGSGINFKVIAFTQPAFKPVGSGFKLAKFDFLNLPAWAASPLLIWPPSVVQILPSVRDCQNI